MTTTTEPDPPISTTEEGENTFTHVEEPMEGSWEVRCRVQVTDSNGIADADQGTGTFMLAATEDTR
jgi:hypothetical protein